jgi:hypothetical protein
VSTAQGNIIGRFTGNQIEGSLCGRRRGNPSQLRLLNLIRDREVCVSYFTEMLFIRAKKGNVIRLLSFERLDVGIFDSQRAPVLSNRDGLDGFGFALFDARAL